VDITTTIKGTGYMTDVSGTSVAAPHVVGAIALLASIAPESSLAARKAAILHSVDQVPSLRGRLITGGRLNVAVALDEIRNPSPLPIVLSATPATSRTSPDSHIRVEFSKPMDIDAVESTSA
jgi:subtilisin family serine protease